MRKFFILVVCLFGLLIGFASLYVVPFDLKPMRILLVPPGASLKRIAIDLQEASIIRSSFLFRTMIRLQGNAQDLQAGEYALSGHLSMRDVALKLRSGDVVMHSLSLVEGVTEKQFLAQLEQTSFLQGNIENALGEGWLLPDTYSFARDTLRQTVLLKMNRAMERFLNDAWESRAEGLPLDTPYEALILASIVEKETAIAEERGLVASVFINRLRAKMRLQSDPTIVYGLTDGVGVLGRSIRKSEIRRSHPHNTYVIKGLPPTPIAYPGRASILAVLNPISSDYFYFVADGTGGHAFSRTLAEHNRNVRKWRANR